MKQDLPPSANSFELSRRSFLGLAVGIGAAAVVGCSAEERGPTSPTASAKKETQGAEELELPDSRYLDSDNEVVEGLGRAEKLCERRLFKGAMEFLAIPGTSASLEVAKSWHADALAQINEVGLRPIVILEPGEGVTYGDMSSMKLDEYFSMMKKRGVKDRDWGRVVVAPEFIVGEWPGNEPQNFVPNVEHATGKLREYFPDAEPTILIDTDPKELDALLPRLGQFGRKRAELGIESVGVQAYANAAEIPFSKDGEAGIKADIARFLSADVIEKIAKATGTKKVWINTGITKEDAELGVSYTPEQRKAVANAIADVIKEVQQRGIVVDDLVIFMENKIDGKGDNSEGRDFSFPPGHEPALITLDDRLKDLGVPLAGFAVPK